jgi:hypothetical protein
MFCPILPSRTFFSELVLERDSAAGIDIGVTAYTQRLTGEKHVFVSPVLFLLKKSVSNLVLSPFGTTYD